MAAIFNLSYGALGEHGRKMRHNVYIPRGTLTLAQIQSFSDDYVVLLDAALDTKVLDAQLVVELALPGTGLKAAAVDGSDAGRGGVLSFSADATSYSQGVYLPGVIESSRIGEKALYTADPSVIHDLVVALTIGIDEGGTVIAPSDRSGATLVALTGASQSKRK